MNNCIDLDVCIRIIRRPRESSVKCLDAVKEFVLKMGLLWVQWRKMKKGRSILGTYSRN